MRETFYFSDGHDFNRSKTTEGLCQGNAEPGWRRVRGLLLQQAVRQQIHPSAGAECEVAPQLLGVRAGRGRVWGGTPVSGGEGWLGQRGAASPTGLTAGSLGSMVFIPPGKASFSQPGPFNGRKRLFPRLGIPSNQGPTGADLRGKGGTLALPQGEVLVQRK